MSAKIHGRLFDWQDTDLNKSMAYDVFSETDSIVIYFTDGTQIWVERQDGRIRVHSFRPYKDEPVNVEIYSDRIEVDRHDYDQESGS